MIRRKFVVDAMLGKLARWLRILGYDTSYDPKYEDWKIIKIAEDEKRIIITRDRGLCQRAKKRGLECFYIIPGTEIEDMLARLALKYNLDLTLDPNFSRCSVCNGILRKIDDNLWECSKCGKKYWKGAHWRTMENILIRAKSKIKTNEPRTVSNNTRT
jgi:uncharacterized protein with PIN domain